MPGRENGAVRCTENIQTGRDAEGGMLRSKCGDATNSKLTEGAKSKWVRSMLVSESRSFPTSDGLCVDVAGLRYMVLVKR